MQQQQAERNGSSEGAAIVLGRRRGIRGRELAAALGLDPSAVTTRTEAARSRGKENAEVAKLEKPLGRTTEVDLNMSNLTPRI
jgi:hypothetical protein